jgi:hypothetical protein
MCIDRVASPPHPPAENPPSQNPPMASNDRFRDFNGRTPESRVAWIAEGGFIVSLRDILAALRLRWYPPALIAAGGWSAACRRPLHQSSAARSGVAALGACAALGFPLWYDRFIGRRARRARSAVRPLEESDDRARG